MKLTRIVLIVFLTALMTAGIGYASDKKDILKTIIDNATAAKPAPVFKDNHGNSPAKATAINPDSKTRGTIDPPGDTDYFTFFVTKDGELSAHTEGPTGTRGALLSGQGGGLASGAAESNGAGFKLKKKIGPGTYYLKVESGGDAAAGPYTLFVKFIPREDENEEEKPDEEDKPDPQPAPAEEDPIHLIPEGWYKWQVKETGNTCGFPAVKLTGFVKLTYLEKEDKVRMDFSNGSTYFAEAMDPEPEEPGGEVDPAINVVLGMEKTSMHDGSVVIGELWEITLYDKDGGVGVGFSTTTVKSPDIDCKITHGIHVTKLDEVIVKDEKLDEKLEKAGKNKKK